MRVFIKMMKKKNDKREQMVSAILVKLKVS